ncbi:PRC-barrel domain containing protein [Streptomyces sp. NPDC008313]|uniref:PRC-barrel domain containing protein n=1 Tax=Streptomyces sp. NPDC008313 TaxID=3364826 RepID=UPI0036E25FC0
MINDAIWSYPPGCGHTEGLDLTEFTVEASDGTVGHVDRQADASGRRHLVVDTGVWVFGRSLLVPVGAVSGVDPESRTLVLACTRDQVKAAPEFRTDRETQDPAYLAAVGEYYRGLPPAEVA